MSNPTRQQSVSAAVAAARIRVEDALLALSQELSKTLVGLDDETQDDIVQDRRAQGRKIYEALNRLTEDLIEPCSTCGHGEHSTCPCRLYDEPDPDGDRDHPGIPTCPSCKHDLELDAELRCSRCGAA
jgi:hypothetical protein